MQLLAAAMCTPPLAFGAPVGGVVTQGSASISQTGPVTSVQQSTQKAAINWQSFSVGSGETVNFQQPSATAVLLNRVVGNERSVIEGAMNANGQVFLVNSAGILFSQGSSVNVGGLVASTRPISDADFMAGRNVFGGSGTAGVVNQGSLTAADGGYIALLGASVSNQGVITATRGTVALAAGDMITLSFSGSSLLSVSVDQGTLDALVENQQAIYADGGTVLLTAKAASELLRSTVNVGGVVQAQTIDDLLGRVEVHAHGGTTSVTGTIDARAIGAGNGGFIETSGDTVKVSDSAQILTRAAQGRNGKWLVDPNDFTIAASGGDITGAFLSNYLDTQGDYEVQSVAGARSGNGDIHVNDAITWGSDNKLTLTAQRDININNTITVNGAGGQLALNFGGDYRIRTPASYAGAVLDADGKPVANTDTSGGVYGSVTFNNDANLHGLTINGDVYTLIHSMAQWDALDSDAFIPVIGHFAIAKDLEAGGTSYSIAPVYFFSGTLAGLGHKISNFTMDSTVYAAGLIGDGRTYGTVDIRDLGMENIRFTNINGGPDIGYMAGAILGEGSGTIRNVYSTGAISLAQSSVGGIVGRLNGTLSSSFSTVEIVAANLGGGGGGLAFSVSNGGIVNSHATGNFTVIVREGELANANAGGLAASVGGVLENSYATGSVVVRAAGTAAEQGAYQFTYLGGLVGTFDGTSLKNSFATGDVAGGMYVGGLAGSIGGQPVRVENVYATGNVSTALDHSRSGNAYAGGLFGVTGGVAHISDVFATGDVAATTGGSHVGGLIGSFGTNIGVSAASTLTNAYSTGNVSVAVVPGVLSSGAGGLIGTAVNANISNVHADGNVSGDSHVGGLIGTAAYSSISDSYAKGAVSANDKVQYGAGGFIGYVNQSTTSNVYYNSDANSQAFFGEQFGNNTQDMRGLKGEQLGDSQHYANGTIGQVLAQRAAEAAAEEARRAAEAAAAAAEAARVAAEAAAAEAQRAAEAAAAEAQRLAEAAAAEARRVAEAAAQEARRIERAAYVQSGVQTASAAVAQGVEATARPAQTAPPGLRPPAATLDQNIVVTEPKRFSANVREIEVDGQKFYLEDDEPSTGKPR